MPLEAAGRQRNHYPGLDGLRGIAIILVLIYHNFFYFSAAWYGQFGVDLFFVISGFLITDILLNNVNHTGYFINFYSRRVLRIFPIYYLCLIILFFILPKQNLIESTIEVSSKNHWWFWTYLQNWFFSKGAVDTGTIPVTHFWSLAVEEQFYLIWPLVIFFIRNVRKLFFACTAALILLNIARISVWIYSHGTITEEAFIVTRCDGVFVGCAIAALKQKGFSSKDLLKLKSILFIAFLSGIYLLINFISNSHLPCLSSAGFTGISLFFGWVVYQSISTGHSLINKLFRVRVFKFFGNYSYGIYVFHFPVMYLLHPYTEKWLWPLTNNRIPESLLLIAAEITVAVLVYHLYEKHFFKLKNYFS